MALAVAVLLMVAGCGSSASGAGSAGSARTRIDPYFDFGQTVLITDKGFQPRSLVCVVGQPVVWKNTSSHTESVVFDHQLAHSGPIPPGGTYTYTPKNVESMLYHSANDPKFKGQIQSQPDAQ